MIVTATDPFTMATASSDQITVDITVTNVDEAPKLTGEDSPRFAENTAVATAVATYAVTDDEDTNNEVDLKLSGADAAQFSLTDNDNDATYELYFMQLPNYEDPADAGTDNEYEIMVVATDSDEQTDMIGRNRDGDQRGRGGHGNAVDGAATGWGSADGNPYRYRRPRVGCHLDVGEGHRIFGRRS